MVGGGLGGQCRGARGPQNAKKCPKNPEKSEKNMTARGVWEGMLRDVWQSGLGNLCSIHWIN